MRRTPEAFDAYFAQMSPEEQAVVKQYQAVAGAFDALWKEIYARTEYKEWEKDGVGSCDIDEALSEEGIGEIDILKLRRMRNRQTPGHSQGSACPNHRPGVGCVLGDLKSRKCLDHVPLELDKEIEERFDIRIEPIRPVLDIIQIACRDFRNGDWTRKPEANEELVQRTLDQLQGTTDYIKSFPVLSTQTDAATGSLIANST